MANKYNIYFRFAFFVAIVVAFFACEFSENEDEGKLLIKEITEDIDSNAFWNNKTVYIIRKADFKINGMLIIQNGVTVKFDPQSGRSITVTDSGFLSVQGLLTKPVIFTSLYDPNFGQIANNSNYPQPKTGDWDAIYLSGKLPSSFKHAKIMFGGGGSSQSTVVIDSTYAHFYDCTFEKNKGGDVDNGNGVLNAIYALPGLIIKDCFFYNNDLPLAINSLISVNASNYFSNPKNQDQTNRYNAIKVHSIHKINRDVYWDEDEVPYVIRDSIFEIGPNVFLALNKNVALKFCEGSQLIISDGIYSIRNQNGIGVSFTSINDDSIKGDTRADKLAKIPKNGDWNISIRTNDQYFEWRNVYFATKNER